MNSSEKSKLFSIKSWLGTGSINIFGYPFSGKDTHGHELASQINGKFISGGDILRSLEDSHSIRKHIASGDLAPTEDFLAIVLPYLSQKKFEKHPLILGSIGRWHGEEDSVIHSTYEAGHPIKAVIYLKITEEEVLKRWRIAERNRDDDSEIHIIENRLEEFRNKTLPVINYYRDKNLLIEIDGMPLQNKVSVKIIDEIYLKAKDI